jgi:GNAT superfamily N-acetyltransferase
MTRRASRGPERSPARRRIRRVCGADTVDALIVAIAEAHAATGILSSDAPAIRRLAGEPIPRLPDVSLIAVDPVHWGGGTGRALMERVVAHGCEQGYERAQRPCARFGFVAEEREEPGDGGETIRLFVAQLGTTG